MKVIANYSVHLLGTSLVLQEGKTYNASPATNQPDYKEKKLYFVDVPKTNGDSILCTMGEEIQRI